jgi:hypothetical protein
MVTYLFIRNTIRPWPTMIKTDKIRQDETRQETDITRQDDTSKTRQGKAIEGNIKPVGTRQDSSEHEMPRQNKTKSR